MSEQARHLALFPRDAWHSSFGYYSYAAAPAVCNQAKFTNGSTMAFTLDPEWVTCSKCLRWLRAVPA